MIYMCVIAIQEQSTYIFFRMTGSPGAIARVVNLYFYHRLLMHTSKWCMMVHSFLFLNDWQPGWICAISKSIFLSQIIDAH